MTVLIGYVPTPVGEAALEAGLAEAAAHGDDAVILNSPRRGSTVDASLVGPEHEARLVAAAAALGVTASVDHADHGADIVEAFCAADRAHRCPAGRHRPAPALARWASWSWAATRSACCSSSTRRCWPSSPPDEPPRRISRVVVTPVAFADPPLLNVVGVHQPWALRAIVEVHTDSGLLGLGETYADEAHLARLPPSPRRWPARPVRPRRRTSRRRRRPRQGDRRGGRELRRDARREVRRRHRPLPLRGRLHRPPGPRDRATGERGPGRPGARPGAVQRLPLLQVGGPPGLRPTTRGARR